MLLRPLGSTDLHVSPVGFGCWQLGGDGWGRYSLAETQAAVRRAVELGINVFDTAPVYGFGRSEELLAASLGSERERVLVISKVGLVWDDRRRVRHDLRPESLRGQVEGSLRRLKRSALDVLLFHWPDPAVPLAETTAAAAELKAQGLVRAWGLSNFPAAEVTALAGEPLVLQYPLNVLALYAAECVDAAAAGEALRRQSRPNWGFIAYDALARGILGGARDDCAPLGKRDLRRRDVRFAGGELQRNLARATAWHAAHCPAGATPAGAAVRAVSEMPAVACCLVGAKNPPQIEACAAAVASH